MRSPIVPISNSLDELALLELQGLMTPKSQSFERLCVGPLTIEGDVATLVIGNHEISGKIQTLEKPLLVLERGNTSQIRAVAVVVISLGLLDHTEKVITQLCPINHPYALFLCSAGSGAPYQASG
jgi:hypothetical protein